jgi:hypothetical protein
MQMFWGHVGVSVNAKIICEVTVSVGLLSSQTLLSGVSSTKGMKIY